MNSVQIISIATLIFLIILCLALSALRYSAYSLYPLTTIQIGKINLDTCKSEKSIILYKFSEEEELCPPNIDNYWAELGDFCYHVSQEAMDWGVAQEYCWGLGGYLAEIMSRDEEDLLDTFLIEGTSYWIGLTDLSHEGFSREMNSWKIDRIN